MVSRFRLALATGILLLLAASGGLAGASVQQVTEQSGRQAIRPSPLAAPTPTPPPTLPPDAEVSKGVPPKVKLQGPAWPLPTPSPPLIETPITPTVILPERFLNAIQDVTFPIIEHPASQEFPRISGNHVVWQDARYGPTDIFMADLDTGEIENVTASGTWEVVPDIDGDIIVWKDGYNGIGIHGINLATNQVFTVTEGKNDVSKPRVSGNIVVWADNRRGEWDVYGYDIATDAEFVISDATGDQRDPNIDGNIVVWWDNRHGDNYNDHIYAYNLTTGTEIPVATNYGDKEFPDVSGDTIVWLDARNGNWDIYAYDLSTQTERPLVVQPGDQREVVIDDGLVAWQDQTFGTWDVYLYVLANDLAFPVSRNSGMQTMPAVGGSVVVWQDNRNHQWDIFGFTWEGTPPPETEFPVANPTGLQVGAFPEGRIRLQWQDNSGDEQGFRVERATGIIGVTWTEIVSLPANTTVYDDTPDVLDESFWYRLRAFNAAGTSAYSNESFNSTFWAAPNLDEMYLLVLINEARADPAAFGYPSYPSVPPLTYNPLVNYSAHSHSQSILNSDAQFGHCDPAGRCPTERAQAVGYQGGCGENLILGGDGPTAVEGSNQAFMDSEGHRNNMLAPGLVEAGIGHAYDLRKGSVWHGQYTEVLCGRSGVTIPTLPSGSVVPYTGTLETAFTYIVNFYSADGYAPSVANVYIDGVPHEMSLSTGTAAHGTYRYATTLSLGFEHEYYFHFEYGLGLSARWPETGAMNFPDVRPYMPDLQPGSPWSSGLVVGYEGRISTYVHNDGEIPAENVAVQFYLGDPEQGGTQLGETQIIARIEPGEGQTVNVAWQPATPGTYTIYVWVDPAGTIIEADESNNLASTILEVREAIIWYVDTSMPSSGDGRTPETAFKTISEALPHAFPGDTVQVAAGTYNENVSVPGGLHLIGAGSEVVTIQGISQGTVLYAGHGSVVGGFTITGSGQGYWDAGIWIGDDVSPTIGNNRIVGNSMGIVNYCFAEPCTSAPVIRNNVVTGNRYPGIIAHLGVPQIINNTVVGNETGIVVDADGTAI
ncbi:MAG: DUF1565 domain-containing protein, partial [Ardenticatenia bacterium]|nr:DUF1565 domain-containing protein [Ardenticatenia bacterium]